MISHLIPELAPAPASPAILPPAAPRLARLLKVTISLRGRPPPGYGYHPGVLQQDRVTAAAGLVVDDRDLLAALGGT